MLRIMIADDSRFFRTIERQFLQKTPTHVIEVADSDDLFVQLQGEKPQLLFLAYSLRPLGGVECYRKIRRDPRTADLSIVMICDQDMPLQVEEIKSVGCNAVLVKPLDRFRFLEAARLFLSEIREHRYSCFMQVQYECGGTVRRGKSLDISGGGIFIESAEPLPLDSLVSLTFTLPDGVVTVSCHGVVVWHNRRPHPLKPHYAEGFGIRFLNPPRQFTEELRRFAGR